jgi:hypothetical protein
MLEGIGGEFELLKIKGYVVMIGMILGSDRGRTSKVMLDRRKRLPCSPVLIVSYAAKE